MNNLQNILAKKQGQYASILPFDLNKENLFIFDFTKENVEFAKVDLKNTEQFTAYVFDKLKKNNTPVGIGKYNEDRTIYKRSEVFEGAEEARTVHLGIDLWAVAGTPVFAPLEGKVHSFKNNASYGDYGPTIIMEHMLEGVVFYTLYGHLSVESLAGKKEGMPVKKGEKIAALGDPSVNVQWPPHLHFQIITDLLSKKGDFFGVAPLSQRAYFTSLCPDPNLILGVEKLK